MTDQITRARKEWCEPAGQHPVFGDAFNRCPPEVVAALLDLRNAVYSNHGGRKRDDECEICVALDAADAVITRELEGKP